MVGFSGKWLYMAATHGSMFIRVQTDHVAVKTDEKRVLGHGRRKPRPNDHSVCNPGQKMETVHFGRKCCTWHPHMELCPFGCKRTMVG